MTTTNYLSSGLIALLFATTSAACATEPNYPTYGISVAAYDAQGMLVDSTCYNYLSDLVDSEITLLMPSATVPDDKTFLASIKVKQAGGASDYALRVLNGQEVEVASLTYTSSQYKSGSKLTETIMVKDQAYRLVVKGIANGANMVCPVVEATLPPSA